jgi:hypothetical protein
VNADTGQLAAIRDQVTEQRAEVLDLTRSMLRILEAVEPILRFSAERSRQHATRSDHIRHTGRHRRDRMPPRCES